MAISTLTVTDTENFGVQASNNLTGTDYTPPSSNQTIKHVTSLGTSIANSSLGGSDEAFSSINSITASSSVSVDLTNFTDIMQTAAASLVRVKQLLLRLLNATQDSVNGNAAASVTVDGTVANALLSASGTGWLTNATSKFDVGNGGRMSWASGLAAGVAVSGTSKIVKIINNDGSLTAKAQLSGAGGST